MARRLVIYINIAILIVIAAALLLVYWFAWRPLPQVSGTVRAPVSQRVTVVRDALGVPHITAASIDDALLVQGYVTAQDRLWQMDMLRRLAGGTLSQVAGSAALEPDREARRLRTEHLAEQAEGTMTPADRAALAAYARGVNWFIEKHRGRLGVEFALMRYDPAPWRIADAILLGLHMYRGLSSTWRLELQKAALLEGGDTAKVEFLFPAKASWGVPPGSNAWVLAGTRTASGRPLLSNDPHLEYSVPSIWHMVHLRAPGLNVAGIALPGVPGVIVGHNDRIGWGVTNLMFDVQDFYIERLDPQNGRYVYEGKLEQARLEHDRIPVKGGAPVEFAQWVTRHGPVMVEQNRILALRWAAEGGFSFPIVELDRARNWQEFTAALSRYPGPAQNFVYADVDGNIGYHAAGRLPIRRTYNGDVPVDGSTGTYEWDGYIPFDQLPHTYNPSSGIIVTANQNPFPDGYPYRVSGNFTAPFRAEQIYRLLTARKGWRPGDMLSVQKDVYSGLCQFLGRELVTAYDRRGVKNPDLEDAVGALRKWNGQMERGPAPLVATLLYQHLLRAIAERASPGKGLGYDVPWPSGGESVQMAPAVVADLLRRRPREWFADYDQLLLRSFVDAVEEGRRVAGRNVSKWDWGAYNQLLIANPVVGGVPLLGKYFDIGPVEQSGSTGSVKQTTRRLGPSIRTTVDFSNLDASTMNLVTGESGHVLSSHYRDQFDAWYYGRSLPMQFQRVEAKDTLVIEAAQAR